MKLNEINTLVEAIIKTPNEKYLNASNFETNGKQYTWNTTKDPNNNNVLSVSVYFKGMSFVETSTFNYNITDEQYLRLNERRAELKDYFETFVFNEITNQ